ncbi:tetratricopeptide repeat protein [Pannus brasiliensis]
MQGLIQKIVRAIREFFRSLFGGRTRRVVTERETVALTDTDYEFLFMQLLDGVAHGWHEGRILKFFEKLGDRGRQRDWVEWLDRFGTRLQSSAANNQQLALRMIRLGELARAFPGIERVGEAAYQVGYQLYTKETENLIWEFAGPDGEPVERPEAPADNGENPRTETISLEELFDRLQTDPVLAGQMAEQLGIEGTDANAIIENLLHQFQAQEAKSPETAAEWFQIGLQQANSGDWEGAIACWDNALDLDPDLAPGWHNRGSALALLGRYEEALESFDRAIAINPEDAQIWNARGNALYGLQRWEEALSCWDKVLQLQEDFYQAWYNRGSTLENLDRNEEALDCYRKALEIAPDFDLAKSRLEELLGSSETS